MHRSHLLTVFFLTALFISACREDVDTERPVVSILSPMDGETVTTSPGLLINALLTDNEGLLQYKLILEGIKELNGIAKDTTLRIIHIDGLSGAEFVLDELVELPDSTFNGQYRVILWCLDTDGNESYADTVNVRVVNILDSIPPAFDVQGYPEDTLRLGQGFALAGSVTDETSLNYVTLKISNTDGSKTLLDFQFPNIIDNTVNLEGFGGYFLMDSSWTDGTYSIYITAWDDYSGVTDTSFFQVKR